MDFLRFRYTFAKQTIIVRYLILLLFFTVVPYAMHAQDRFWIRGNVISADSLLPVKNVHIISRMARSGTISDQEGSFAIRGYAVDSLMFSAIGFEPRIFRFDAEGFQEGDQVRVLLQKDTIMMDEVVVRSFYDWPTFKQLFVNMPSIKPANLDFIDQTLKDLFLSVRPSPLTIKGPVQALYDLFNDASRMQRKLERNRQAYNQQLRKEGKLEELIPEVPEHREEELRNK